MTLEEIATRIREERDEALAALDRARADLALCREERDRLRGDNDQLRSLLGFTATERDRLRAVLADTKENVRAVVELIPADAGLALSRARKILAALRARAGMDVCSTCGRADRGPSVCSNPFHVARAGVETAAVKFRRDRPEEVCGKRVPGPESDRYEEHGGLACLRIAGHAGDCISLACDAAQADGVCHACRNPLGGPHDEDCAQKPPAGMEPTP